jgi:large subunit ribosomal protein L16
MERCYLTARQIEAARKTITGATKRGGKLWIRAFPSKPITKKPIETRMGKGKGGVEYYAAVVKPGKILFEISGVEESLAKEAFKLAAAKLPIKTKVVSVED